MNVSHPDRTASPPPEEPRAKRRIRWAPLLISVAIPLAVGGGVSLLLGDSTSLYETLLRPPLSPPPWVFPVMWTLLYLLMGIACYLVWVSSAGAQAKKRAFIAYGIQLAINALWSPLFFLWGLFSVSAAVIVLLMVLVTVCLEQFARCSRPAARLLLPYLLWTAFAAYLNFGIALLN